MSKEKDWKPSLKYPFYSRDTTKKTMFTEITKDKIINIDDNNKLVLVYGYYERATLENGYYMQKQSVKRPYNRYLQLVPVHYYGRTFDTNPWNFRYFNASTPYDNSQKSVVYTVFRVSKIADTLEEVKSNSWLKKYVNVLHNNDYFSAIPQTNELWHWDNYVDIYSTYDYEITYDPNTQTKLYNQADNGQIKNIPLNSRPDFTSDDWEHFDYTGYYYETWDNFKLSLKATSFENVLYTKEGAKGHIEL